jgi:hypothetical protein
MRFVMRKNTAILIAVAIFGTVAANSSVRALPAPPAFRYIYFSRGPVAANNGWNLMDVGPSRSAIDSLPAGTRALVWVGDYNNTTCSFEVTKSQLTADGTAVVVMIAWLLLHLGRADPYAC